MRQNDVWQTFTPGAAPYWPHTPPTRTYHRRLADGSIFSLRLILRRLAPDDERS